MENFVWDIPTKLHFGRDVHEKIRNVLPEFGSRALLIRGGDSLVRNGVYEKILQEIEAAGMEYAEYSGIKPNPRIEDVRKATELSRSFSPDIILAVGGGSVIDSAKAVAAASLYDNDPWDLYTGVLKSEKVIPIIAVLTLAATGTEMNPFSVVQNRETGLKSAFSNKNVAPVHSFLNPAFTISVPRNYTAYGISDLVAHAMEAYFGVGDATLADRFVVSIIQEAREFGPALLRETDNYDLRAKIMYAATCALNETTMFGRLGGDWGVHSFGHVFSLLYDIPHGATLSAVYPAWLRLMKDRIPDRIKEFGKAVFGTENCDECIVEVEKMFSSFLSPTNLKDLKLSQYSRKEIVEHLVKSKASGYFHKLDADDYERILDLME